MLEELRIQNLGVIEELSLILPAGSIAVTGETGAGKTMVVGAIQLLMGGRAEPDMVRVGSTEAIVEGRFVGPEGEETVAKRVVPADGRSRAYLDGSLATASALADRIGPLIDLHGQHSQQSLLKPSTQRAALDRFGSVDLSGLTAARSDLTSVDAALADLGGDATERARQVDLLRYQLDELTAAALSDTDEDETLKADEARLANAYDYQLRSGRAAEQLGGDGATAEALAEVAAGLGDDELFSDISARLRVVQDELSELAAELRTIHETTVDDPEARESIRARLQLLVELRRKYGPTLADVIDYQRDTADRLATLEAHETRVRELLDRRKEITDRLESESEAVASARREAAKPLATAVETELDALAMPNASVTVTVDGPAGDDVAILLSPNPGQPALPVGRNASGGELSRTMLALRLVLSGGPPIKIFDEVDAGIGGETARAVGTALATIGDSSQVFVVTHLPQVAALTAHHVVIDKSTTGGATRSQAVVLDEGERVVEVSRMLSGSPESASARDHAEELLAHHRRDPSTAGR